MFVVYGMDKWKVFVVIVSMYEVVVFVIYIIIVYFIGVF